MTNRSDQREVRNPILKLQAVKRLLEFLAAHPELALILADLLGDLVLDARARAQESWRKNKGPMAVYWKGVGAYAHHLCRVVRWAARRRPDRQAA